MFQGSRIGAVLLMGGEGRRLGGEVPKQFRLLGDKKVYLHTLEAFLQADVFDEIILVCHPKWIEIVRQETQATVVAGGTTRQASSYAGLKGFSQKPDIVVIHDAVRPFVSEKILMDNIRTAIACGAVDTCIPSADTIVYALKDTIENIPERSHYFRGQTPQTFCYEWILKAHALTKDCNSSDDCRLMLATGQKIHIVAGSEENIKITTDLDLQIAENLLARKKSLANFPS